MKFEELKKSLQVKLQNNYLLLGSDNFLLSRAKDIILNKLNIEFEDLNYINFSGDLIDFKQVVESLNTLPAFSKYKCVFVDLSNKGVKILNEKYLDNYLSAINELSILIIKIGEQLNVLNGIKDKFVNVDCNKISPSLVKSFVVKEFEKSDKKINENALNLLYDYGSGDMQNITNEIPKIVAYVGNKNVIDIIDIESIVTKTTEFQIFELTENLGKKSAERVYEILNIMRAKKDGLRGLISLIYNHFRRLLYVAINGERNTKDCSIYLGIKEFAVKKYFQQSKYFSKQALKSICQLAMDLDFDTKQSKISYNMAVDTLILKILNI